ncbi:hypothetical protein ACJX0J_014381, partial [Zea mays]
GKEMACLGTPAPPPRIWCPCSSWHIIRRSRDQHCLHCHIVEQRLVQERRNMLQEKAYVHNSSSLHMTASFFSLLDSFHFCPLGYKDFPDFALKWRVELMKQDKRAKVLCLHGFCTSESFLKSRSTTGTLPYFSSLRCVGFHPWLPARPAPPFLARREMDRRDCPQIASMAAYSNSPPSGISRGTRAINHRTVRCTPDSVRCAKEERAQELASFGKLQRLVRYNSPDCPV